MSDYIYKKIFKTYKDEIVERFQQGHISRGQALTLMIVLFVFICLWLIALIMFVRKVHKLSKVEILLCILSLTGIIPLGPIWVFVILWMRKK